MKVMGIDPSTNTGWAVITWDGDKWTHETGVQKMRETGIKRARYAKEWMEGFVLGHEPELIVMEGYAYSNHNTLATLVEIGTGLRLGLSYSGYPWHDCPPTTLKKFVCGKGNAKKEHVLLDVFKRWKVYLRTNDEADAFGLAMLGFALSRAEGMDLTQEQMKVAKTLLAA